MTRNSALTAIGPLLTERFERIRQLYESGQSVTGLPSGLHAVDRLTGGFRAGQLTLVLAGPRIGKTSFLLSLAAAASIRHRRRTALFTASETTDRLIAAETGIDSAVLENARLTADHWPLLTAACEALADAPLYLDDDPALTATLLNETLSATPDIPELVLVDDLQALVVPTAPTSSLVSRAREIKEIAVQLGVVFVAALLPPTETREPETGRPLLYELRQAGLVGAADVVLLIDRDPGPLADGDEDEIADLIVVRNRNGRNDTARVAFHRRIGKFADLS